MPSSLSMAPLLRRKSPNPIIVFRGCGCQYIHLLPQRGSELPRHKIILLFQFIWTVLQASLLSTCGGNFTYVVPRLLCKWMKNSSISHDWLMTGSNIFATIAQEISDFRHRQLCTKSLERCPSLFSVMFYELCSFDFICCAQVPFIYSKEGESYLEISKKLLENAMEIE